MNKKLLFAAMSLLAFTACTDNDFESQKVAEEVGSVQFEVLNNDDAFTRASMNGNKVEFSATDGDLFTLYHGAVLDALTGHQNATYTAEAAEGEPAVLTTPSMIKEGGAVMVWPVDTTFYYEAAPNPGKLSIKIPAVQGGKVNNKEIIQNQIPYVSDEINIGAYVQKDDNVPATYTNKAGYKRIYPVFMRPMASQLNLKAFYVGMDKLDELATGTDPIDPIKLTSVELNTTGGTTDFSIEIPVQFTDPGTGAGSIKAQWDAAVANNAWNKITDFDMTDAGITKSASLTTKCLNGNESCKFLILPQKAITVATATDGVAGASVVVNTIYGKVVVGDATVGGKYNTAPATGEIEDAWYRYVSSTTAVDPQETKAGTAEPAGSDNAGKFKTTSAPALGLAQTINAFSSNKASKGLVKGESQGATATRYVKVLLKYLDMSALHVETDKQLYDAVRVWDKLGLASVTVYLDGKGTSKSFEISQKTIKKINEINKAATGRSFSVKPCATHVCDEIVVTGGDKIEDMTFIVLDGTHKADVVLKAEESWKWDGTIKLATAATTGVKSIINKGTLTNNADKVLAITDNTTPTANQLFTIPLINDGTWNVTAGTLRVQFNVTNNGQVNISKGAQYHQDGQDVAAKKTTFTNEATDKPSRFGGNDSKIGKVENKGVFATIGGADINNYGLIEHADKDAKTYITANQTLNANGFSADASFTTAFKHDATGNTGNKMGRINLPYSNKGEDNISVSAALAQGFVSVTVTTADAPSDGILNASVVGNKVNYVIVNGGIESIAAVATQVKYVEFNQPNTEIEWAVAEAGYDGLMVLSPVNIKLDTKVAATVTYIGSEMYVGGTFNKDAAVTIGTTPYAATLWNGYYGNTTTAVATKYITF